MKVLVACEYSARVRDAFIARGHDAISADFRASEHAGPHYRGHGVTMGGIVMTSIMRVEIASSVFVAAYALSQNESYDIPRFYQRISWNQEPNQALARLFLEDFSGSIIGSWWVTLEWRTLPLPADLPYDIRAALYQSE